MVFGLAALGSPSPTVDRHVTCDLSASEEAVSERVFVALARRYGFSRNVRVLLLSFLSSRGLLR